jgi:hypothetical protein
MTTSRRSRLTGPIGTSPRLMCGLVAAAIDPPRVLRAIRARQTPPTAARSCRRAGARSACAVKRPVAGRSLALQTP